MANAKRFELTLGDENCCSPLFLPPCLSIFLYHMLPLYTTVFCVTVLLLTYSFALVYIYIFLKCFELVLGGILPIFTEFHIFKISGLS